MLIDDVQNALNEIADLPDERDWQIGMTRVLHHIWTETRTDPFPSDDLTPLAEHMSGLPKDDAKGLVSRVMTFGMGRLH